MAKQHSEMSLFSGVIEGVNTYAKNWITDNKCELSKCINVYFDECDVQNDCRSALMCIFNSLNQVQNCPVLGVN